MKKQVVPPWIKKKHYGPSKETKEKFKKFAEEAKAIYQSKNKPL